MHGQGKEFGGQFQHIVQGKEFGGELSHIIQGQSLLSSVQGDFKSDIGKFLINENTRLRLENDQLLANYLYLQDKCDVLLANHRQPVVVQHQQNSGMSATPDWKAALKIEALKEQLRLAEEQAHEWETKFRYSEDDNKKLNREVVTLNNIIGDRDAKVDKQDDEQLMQAIISRLGDVETKLANSEKENKELRKTNAQLKSEVKELNNYYDKTQKEKELETQKKQYEKDTQVITADCAIQTEDNSVFYSTSEITILDYDV